MTCCCCRIPIPGTELFLTPGCRVKLGRFETEMWTVHMGWAAIDGNRPICCWYLVSLNDSKRIKTLQQPDLIDIYLIEH